MQSYSHHSYALSLKPMKPIIVQLAVTHVLSCTLWCIPGRKSLIGSFVQLMMPSQRNPRTGCASDILTAHKKKPMIRAWLCFGSFNTFGQGKNDRHFDDRIFVSENDLILLKFVHKLPIDNTPAFVEINVGAEQTTRNLMLWWPSLTTRTWVTRLLWANLLILPGLNGIMLFLLLWRLY